MSRRSIVVEIELAEEYKGTFDLETEMSPARLETALWQTFHRLFRVTAADAVSPVDYPPRITGRVDRGGNVHCDQR